MATEAGGQGRGMSKETHTGSTSKCSTSSVTPNYYNVKRQLNFTAVDLVNPLWRSKKPEQ